MTLCSKIKIKIKKKYAQNYVFKNLAKRKQQLKNNVGISPLQ